MNNLLISRISLILTTLSLLALQSHGQTKAVTENGDTIYVYNDGTWSFEKLDQPPPKLSELDFLNTKLQIDTIKQEFKAPSNAKKQVKNAKDQFIVKYNDEAWKREPPAKYNEDAEFALISKSSNIWSIVISEETSFEVDKLFLIAKNTMEENTGSEVEILKLEARKVNGKEVLRGVLNANFSGISFIFDSYYYSDDRGSVQFTTWTSTQLWKNKEEEILDLLNGFVVNQ